MGFCDLYSVVLKRAYFDGGNFFMTKAQEEREEARIFVCQMKDWIAYKRVRLGGYLRLK